jgi:hypothetical protein
MFQRCACIPPTNKYKHVIRPPRFLRPPRHAQVRDYISDRLGNNSSGQEGEKEVKERMYQYQNVRNWPIGRM